MDTLGEYRFRVRSYECGKDGCATLPTVCNYLQEAASMHAEELAFSIGDFQAAGDDITWVLTKMRVKMDHYPKWGDEVTVTTFPRGGRTLVAWRDFIVTGRDGETLGVASTEWMIINLRTRKLVAVPQKVFDAANNVRPPVFGEEPFSRIRFPAGEEGGSSAAVVEFIAQNSHIDINGHVNNVHYIEWMLEPCSEVRPSEMEVVFKSETFAGDRVSVSVVVGPDGTRFHRVFAADGKDHIVAVTR